MSKKSRIIIGLISIIIIIIIIIIMFLLLNYTNIFNKVKLIIYANKNYGRAKYISYEENDEEYTVFFKDKEYGFTYSVTSYINSFNIDGTTFFSYRTKKDNYTEAFISYIKKRTQSEFLNIENKYNCTLEWNKYYSSKITEDIIIYVHLKDQNVNKEVTTNLGKIIDEIDSRNHFNKSIIYGEYNDEFIGKYVLKSQSYITSDVSEIEWAMGVAYQNMKIYKNISINSVKELTYIGSEIMDVKDIPNIKNEKLQHRLGIDTEESLKHTKVYYYKYKDEMWLIADCIVSPYGILYTYKLD